MGSNYLDGIEDGYGLSLPLAPGLGELASSIVDSYLMRPEGLVYDKDANGNPCAMKAAEPSLTFTIQGALSPGASVVATVSPAIVRPDLVGEVLVLDYQSPSMEACVVAATSGNNQITLLNVQFAHSANAAADVGRVITEDRSMPNKRSVARVAKWPIINVVSLLGRYAYGRRSDQVGGLYQEMNLLASVQTFGGPPQWIPINVTQSSWSDQSGDIWVPAGMLLAYYSDVRIKYVAGYAQAPEPVVRAAAQIANAITANGGISGNIKMFSAGDKRIQKFTSSILDADIQALLNPFKARTLY